MAGSMDKLDLVKQQLNKEKLEIIARIGNIEIAIWNVNVEKNKAFNRLIEIEKELQKFHTLDKMESQEKIEEEKK